MHGCGHPLAGYLGVAMGDRDRALLVQTEQHLRRLVAEKIHDGVVQPAIARARIERDVRNFQRAQRIGDHVAAESRRVRARQIGRALERPQRWMGRRRFGGRRQLGFYTRHGMNLGFSERRPIEPDQRPWRNRARSFTPA
jgi:hypothetical protein